MKNMPDNIAAKGILGAICGAWLLLATPTFAQEHFHREPYPAYRGEHRFYPGRHEHGHYYPPLGYSVNILPPGYLELNYSRRNLFFHGGVWYTPSPGGFVVVRPPVGVVIPMLPPGYSSVMVAGVPYYYANDTYYVTAPGGYAVASPPPPDSYIEMPGTAAPPAPPPPTPPAAVPAPTPAPAGENLWYYCESARNYYPYVTTCPEKWRAVPAQPAPGH